MIWYSIHETPFNKQTVIASTRKGICAVLFGYGRAAASIELAKMFPTEQLEYESVRNLNFAFGFTEALYANAVMDNFKIDIISGTNIQRTVWEALRKIPRGTTITYSELAVSIGMPKAVRAVASACGKNPVSVIVPCHRVVPKSGGTGKYRWGSEMKKLLLERETQ